MKLTHKVYNHCCFALMRRTRITINYPLIAARSHYMINYMVIICLRIIVPSIQRVLANKVIASSN